MSGTWIVARSLMKTSMACGRSGYRNSNWPSGVFTMLGGRRQRRQPDAVHVDGVFINERMVLASIAQFLRYLIPRGPADLLLHVGMGHRVPFMDGKSISRSKRWRRS